MREPDSPGRDAGSEHRGLGLLGRGKLRFGSVLAQTPEVVAQDLRGLGERLLDDRLGGGERGKHADGLRALTGKCEGERHAGSSVQAAV